MGERFLKINEFLKYEIWRIRLSSLPRKKSFPIKSLRILILSIREYGKDRCALRASALTFYSLTSIVPVVAMVVGVGGVQSTV